MTETILTPQQEISNVLKRARNAQKIAESFSQRKVDELAAAIVYTLSRPETARVIAEMALKESNMGRVDSKMSKLTAKMPAILYEALQQKTVGVIEKLPEKGIVRIAKPIGVIAALIPSTNPEGTPVFKGVLGLRARNAVVFSPHPATIKTTSYVVEIMRNVLEKNGAPADLFICLERANIPLANELMKQSDLTMATGSGDMVRSAYSSGKPSYGVGAGNAVIVVDETANLQDVAEKIAISKTNDWASGCSAENSLVIKGRMYDELLSLLKQYGGYLVDQDQKKALEKAMWPDGKHISREIVAKPAQHIAQLAGFQIGENDRFIMVEQTEYGEQHNFSREKISVVLAVYRYDEFSEAIELVNGIQRGSGLGHSCGIHSTNEEHIMQLALNTYTTKVMVRQPHSMSNSGAWHNGLANTFSLGCGTWGGNIVSENICQKHYFNNTWLSYPINRKPAPDSEIYQDLLDNVVL